ncbi:MAG: OmpA family protein [Bacteroidales bacterium]|nr:OmpA family protein [Bacteroidales bacterium]
MKRFIIVSSLVLFTTLQALAGGHIDSVRYLTSKFDQNWFITADASVNWWQGSDRNPAGNYTTLNGPSFGGSLSLGKWINHNIGLRLSYDVNRGQSYINNYYQRLGFKFLYGDDPQPIDDNHYYRTKFMYHNLHGDVMVSPIDFFQGYYNPNRIYTPVFFVGMGAACVSEHVFVLQSLLNKESRNFELSFDAGLINNFRVNNDLDVNLSLILSGQEWHIDSWYNEYGAQGNAESRPKIADYNYSAQFGLTWYIGGRIYELPYNYEKEMKEFRERIKYLEDELGKKPTEVHDTIVQFVNVTDTVSEIVSFPFSIFFHRDSYQLMSKRDLVNLREIAKVALEKGWKLRLRGSCDSATATPPYNQRLSENRCRKIQMELMEMGVPEEQMILVPVGGVKELDPTEYDRRVLIELVKEIK